MTSGPANKYARPCRLHSEQKEIRTGPDSGPPVSRNSLTPGHREGLAPRVQGLGDSCTCTPSILPQGTKLYPSVPAYGFTQLGLGSYPSGTFVPETPSTSFSLIRSDRPVHATASFRPLGPCQPTSAMAGPTFSYLRNPNPHFSGGPYDFYGRLHSGVGRSHGGFQDFGYLDPIRLQAPYQLSGAQGGQVCPTGLGPSTSGPPGYGCQGQFDGCFIYQQAGMDSLPHLATLDCRSFPLVGVSEHSSPGTTHSRLSELDSRPPISSKSANTDRVVPPPRDRGTYIQGLGHTRSRHVRNTVKLPPSSVHVSNSRAKGPSGGCSVSGLAGEVNVHVSSIPPAQQSHAEASIHSGGRGKWPSQPWLPHLLRLCVEHPLVLPYRRDLLSQQDQMYISDGKSYHLHAWRLSCDSTKQQAFQTRSLGSQQPLGGPQPIACMMIDGFASLDGPQDKSLIHLIPQPLR